MTSRASFTLIELLIVIAIVAILYVVVVLAVNPRELLKQARDSNRFQHMGSINTALTLYQADVRDTSFGTASTVYVSLVDLSATSTAGTTGTTCSTGLPALPSGYQYHCAASSTHRKVDGTGWLPVNLAQI